MRPTIKWRRANELSRALKGTSCELRLCVLFCPRLCTWIVGMHWRIWLYMARCWYYDEGREGRGWVLLRRVVVVVVVVVVWSADKRVNGHCMSGAEG